MKFDTSVYINLILADSRTIIGNRGADETVAKVIGDIGRLSYLAMTKEVGRDGLNPFRRGAMNFVEETDEERIKKANRFYELAGKKILFLNSESKKLGHGNFLRGKVNKEDLDELKWLVEDYMELVKEISGSN